MRALLTSPAVRLGLSVSVATGLYAVSFGALAVAAGLSTLQTCVLSLLMFTGGSQFAFIGTIAGGGAGSTAALAATLLGVRNAVYGVSMSALLRPRGWRRLLFAQVTIDESVAVASSRTDPLEERRGFWTAGLGVFTLWNIFTLVGALLGSAVGDTRAWGLDGAAVAAFLGLLWPRLRSREAGSIAVVCALATALATPFLPVGIPILVAAVVAVAWALWGPGEPRGNRPLRPTSSEVAAR
ncbi:Predicted branched-chain amino acid permease (azaleucine resistance) [Raineyella antarctica]|uniref:Predicted branched-chain amino acid permease (Azaleucine resistance) n=1 Tax=Raineyella antarctica TaxID=1577474 RepID=A0A1G6GPR0_9ACTN|nr:AzlC family ABC transporter permease [Raineyella antarctica]SDB83987.1 Predicted branched-chain amino acid permease (azaleucine resistance) [Raineyella antarctica]